MAISDHNPVVLVLDNFKPHDKPFPWRFPSYLSDNADFCHTIYKAWNDYVLTNTEHVSDPNLFWEAGKAVLGGVIISHTTQFKKHSLE